MSLQAAHRALYGLADVDLNAQQRLVLIFIADHVNDETGLAWMSLARVATFAGMSQRAVRRAIRGLQDTGVLDVVERPGRTSLYRIITPEQTPTTSDRGTPTTDVPPANPTPTTDVRGTPTTSDRGPKPTPTTSGRTPRTLMEGELLMNQQTEDDDDSARGAPPGGEWAARVDLARQIIPDTWTGVAVHADDPRLAVLDDLTGRGWTGPDLRKACAGLPRPRANPTGLLAKHLEGLRDTDPDCLATHGTPTPPAQRRECDHGVPEGAACHDCQHAPWEDHT